MVFLEVIKQFDFFGKEPEFYFKGKRKQTTTFGRILTYIYIVLYIIIFVYKMYRMAIRVDITFYDSYQNTNEIPNIRITNDNFTIVFTVTDDYGDPFIDDTIYYPIAYFSGEEYVDILIERCDPDKLSSEYLDYLRGTEIENYYCLTNFNYDLQPNMNSLRIHIFPCENSTYNDFRCEPKEVIDYYLNYHLFIVYFQDTILTPLDFESPAKPRINQLNTEIYRSLGQYLHTEMQLVRIETSTNIVGFDFLTEPKIEEFLKFDKESVLPFPGYNLFDEDYDGNSVSLFEILLNDKILLEKRQYIQFIDVLGEIGGLMDIMESFFEVICSLIVDVIYENSITNELFSFNINKKIVTIKTKDKINEEKQDDTLFHSLTIQKNKNEEKKEKKEDGIDIYSPDNKLSKTRIDTINKKAKKRNINKKKVKIISEALGYFKNGVKIENIEFISNRSSPKEIVKNSEDHIYNTEYNNNTVKETCINGNNWTIDNISIIDSFLSPFFCVCKTKKGYTNKILLNESMNIISEKLDIINIFKNIYLNEYFNCDKNKDIYNIKMSEECSKALLNI